MMASETLPVRMLVRHVTELTIARRHHWRSICPLDRFAGVTFSVIVNECLHGRPMREPGTGEWIGVHQARVTPRPLSATAIAQSMGVPATTVRRALTQLTDLALIARAGRRIAMGDAFLNETRIAAICLAGTRDLEGSVAILAASGHDPAARALASLRDVPPGVVDRLLLALEIRNMDAVIRLYGGITSGLIVAAVVAANVRHITHDPAMALRYARQDQLPPDDMRRPVTLRAIARAIDLPYETVRRHAGSLIADGTLVASDEGVIVPSAILAQASFSRINRAFAVQFDRMLTDLATLASAHGDSGTPGHVPEPDAR